MSKTKLYLILAVALVFTLAYAAPAMAWTHGQFTATTDACAGCHVAHAAEAPKLLKVGNTQTDFCFYCHGNGGASAPYDVRDGYTVVGGTYRASTAGGFERQWTGPSTYVDLTSRHNVWGFNGESGAVNSSDPAGDSFVPGNIENGTFGGSGFVCASCHDPHAGGLVPDGSGYITGNPRLLRTTVRVDTYNYTADNVKFKFASMGTFTHPGGGSVESGVYEVVYYADGSTNWCGTCHNKFKAPAGSGHNGFQGMYRHAFGFEIPNDLVWPATAFDKTPLEEGTTTGKIACLTCHRAHSSAVSAVGWASSWPRSEGGTSTTSALLRMDNRGVCYNCHGAATQNLP
jgi:predicted CXXCH cytochrome family protein